MANLRLAKDQTDELLDELSKFNTYVNMMTEKIARNGGNNNIIVTENINLITANQADFYETNSALLRSVRDELNLIRNPQIQNVNRYNRVIPNLIRGGRRSRRNNRKNRSTMKKRRGGQIIAFNERAEPVYYQ